MRAGAGDFIAWGNAADNNIVGNSGDNKLRGGQGNDTLDGGAFPDTLTGGTDGDIFAFHAGQTDGDTITDFLGLTVGRGDLIALVGYGTAAACATFVQISPTGWVVTEAGGGIGEVIHLSNSAIIGPTDYHFV